MINYSLAKDTQQAGANYCDKRQVRTNAIKCDEMHIIITLVPECSEDRKEGTPFVGKRRLFPCLK
eukprot:COSAG06_NODE_36473_length_447_cov_0.439655_1_plen_64_part_10